MKKLNEITLETAENFICKNRGNLYVKQCTELIGYEEARNGGLRSCFEAVQGDYKKANDNDLYVANQNLFVHFENDSYIGITVCGGNGEYEIIVRKGGE